MAVPRTRRATARLGDGFRRFLVAAPPAADDTARRLARARSVSWTNECSGTGLSDGRRTIAEVLDAWRLPHLVFEAQLLTTELIENAAQHAGAAQVGVRMVRGTDTVRVEVRDGARERLPVLVEQRLVMPGAGLGLRVVSTAAPQWGCSVDRAGKTVWFELDR